MHSRNSLLFYAFFRREIFSRYVGSMSGSAWALLNPLAQLAVLSFVFSQIFRVEAGANTHGLAYITFVAVALWPWLAFSESVTRGLGAITSNADLVRKVAFPHLLLVLASVSASYAINVAGFMAILIALSFFDPALRLPGLGAAFVLLIPHFILTASVTAALAALQTFVRDVAHAIGVLLTILFYATPIVYPTALVPESMRGWLALNPHAYFSERFRAAFSGQANLDFADFLVALGLVAFGLACVWFFKRLSPYFEELV